MKTSAKIPKNRWIETFENRGKIKEKMLVNQVFYIETDSSYQLVRLASHWKKATEIVMDEFSCKKNG